MSHLVELNIMRDKEEQLKKTVKQMEDNQEKMVALIGYLQFRIKKLEARVTIT